MNVAPTWIALVKEAHKHIPKDALAILPYPRGVVIGVGTEKDRVGIFIVPPLRRDFFGREYVVSLRNVYLPITHPEDAVRIAIQELREIGGSLGTEE